MKGNEHVRNIPSATVTKEIVVVCQCSNLLVTVATLNQESLNPIQVLEVLQL